MSRRIDALAIMKSILERGEDPTTEMVQHFLGVLDAIAPESTPARTPPAGVSPALIDGVSTASSGVAGGVELRLVEVEDRGKFVRAKCSGIPGKKYPMFVSAWNADADVVRRATPGSTIRAEIVEKDNPSGKAPFVNLKGVELVSTAQLAPAEERTDIPF